MSQDPIQAFLSTPSSLTPAEVVNFYADKYGVDKDFAQRIAKQESGFNQKAVSKKGAVGVMQIMPDTAKTLGGDPYDMHQNIEMGVRYLKQNLDQFNGDQRLAAAGYNAGPHRVQQYGGVPPFAETQDYVDKTAQNPTTEFLQSKDPVADFLAQTPEPAGQNVPRGTDSFDVRKFLPRDKKLPDNFNVRKLLPRDKPVVDQNAALIDSLNNPTQGQEVSSVTGQPVKSVTQQAQAIQDFQTRQVLRHKQSDIGAGVEKQRMQMLSALSPEDKLKTGQQIAAQRPLTENEQHALGISPGYMERFAPGMASSLGDTLAGASQLVGYGLTGERDNFVSKGFEKAAQDFRERANLYGKHNLFGDVTEDVGSLVPDIAGSFLAPEGKVAQALYWGASGGLKTAGRGGSAEDIATAAATNAALPAILHGTADLPLVQRVLGSGGLMSTITLAQGGNVNAIAKSFILGGVMGIPGGERSPDDVIAQAADSPDLQRAVFDHYQNPTPENEAALRTAATVAGLKPAEIDTIANQAKLGSASSAPPAGTEETAKNAPTPESLKSTQGVDQNAINQVQQQVSVPIEHQEGGRGESPRQTGGGNRILDQTGSTEEGQVAPPRYQPPSKVKEDLPIHQAAWRLGGIDPDTLTPEQVKAIRAAERDAGLYGKNAILKRSGKSFDDMQQALGLGGTGHLNEYESLNDNSKDAFVEKIINSIRGIDPHYSMERDPSFYEKELDKQYEQFAKDKAANPTIFDQEDAVAKAELDQPDSFLRRTAERVIRSGFDPEAIDAFKWAAGEEYGFQPETIDSIINHLRRQSDDANAQNGVQAGDNGSTSDPIAQFLQESESGAASNNAEAAHVKAERDAELLRIGMQGGRANIEQHQPTAPIDTATPDLFNPQENLFGPGTPSTAQPPDPVGSHIRQLTDALNSMDPKASVKERVSLASRIARQAAIGRGAVVGAITNGRSTFTAIGSTLKKVFGPPTKSSLKYAVGDWDGLIQKIAKDTVDFKTAIKKQVPDPLRREAISNYMHADGDMQVLQHWANHSSPRYRPGYEMAMKLTPDEQTIANNMRQYYDAMLQDGINLGMFKAGLENFVNKIWKRQPENIAKMQAEFGGGLKTDFASMKKAIWSSFFEGEQLGYDPVTKDIADLAAIYNHSFGTAVAGRGLVKAINELTASDGRPMVGFAGSGRVVTNEGATVESNQLAPDQSAIFIKPRTKPAIDLPGAGEHDPKIPINDYKVIDHPALRGWKYVTTGPDGTPVIMQEDMLVHPEGYRYLKNVLGNSWMRQNPITKRILTTQNAAKQMLFGFFSPFHTVQEGVHYTGHAIQSMIRGQHLNPFSLPEVDMSNPNMDLMLRRGLKLYDFNAREALGEGLTGGAITDKIPIIGGAMHAFQDWQFQDFIPRLKAQTALDAFERNTARYKNRLSRDQIAELTANQANASYGGLNYKYMGRNPAFQDFLRMTLIAPDFLEARGRFVGQALKSGGREQLIALGFLAASQFVAGRILSKQFSDDKDWHFDKPFSAVIGNREYKLRSVPGDMLEAVTNTRPFLYNRLSPLMRAGVEAGSGRDIQGQKVTPLQEAIDASSSFVPMQFRLRSNQTLWEKALDSAGLHSKQYRSPADEMMSEFNRDKIGDTVPTADQQKKALTKRDALKGLRTGDTSNLGEAVQSGDMGKTELKSLVKKGTETPRQASFGQLTDDEALQVWNTMRPVERQEVALQLMEKANRYIGGDAKSVGARKQLAPSQIQKYVPLYLEAMKQIPQKPALQPRTP